MATGNSSRQTRNDAESQFFVAAPLTGNAYCDRASEESGLVTHTLRGEGFDAGEDGSGRGTPLATAFHGSTVRRLTPTECLRLQGFPDDWLDGLELSDSAKYRMLGNAVCVNVAEWIARRFAL